MFWNGKLYLRVDNFQFFIVVMLRESLELSTLSFKRLEADIFLVKKYSVEVLSKHL